MKYLSELGREVEIVFSTSDPNEIKEAYYVDTGKEVSDRDLQLIFDKYSHEIWEDYRTFKEAELEWLQLFFRDRA